ncbi:unnamed protein product [Cochlearia groenlandica]
MNIFTIPSSSSSSSSFAITNAYHQPSRLLTLPSNFEFRRLRLCPETRRTSLRCTNKTGPTDSGENENKNVLDAFFLGKALAEVINERIESTVGEVLSNIGRFQAEQQKQVQVIQEEVLERAKRAKERAARETTEAQGLVASKPATINRKPAAGVVTYVAPASTFGNNTISSDKDLINDGS